MPSLTVENYLKSIALIAARNPQGHAVGTGELAQALSVSPGTVTGMLKTPDGVALRFARFEPPAGRRGTVCVFPGRTEWIEKYFETVRDLRNRGFAVALLDWRGQGLSERALADRRKGYVRDFAQYEIDL